MRNVVVEKLFKVFVEERLGDLLGVERQCATVSEFLSKDSFLCARRFVKISVPLWRVV